jgi:ATP-dependent helicase HrpB
VEIVWAPAGQSVPLLADRRVNPALLDQVAALVRRALVEHEGDVLVFLPGESEINAVARRLHGAVAILPLLGRQSAADQDRVLQPGAQRRVVLSTAVAESSLTVPGVRIVVDAGLSREPRTDQGRGLSSLITTRVSRASAEQRAGRAGRLGPGVVYRSWSEADHVHLADHAEPEVAIADLSGFALALARWGSPRGAGLALVDQPATRAMEVAERTLRTLEAVDLHGRITARGRQIGAIGIQPRLARALLDGAAAIGAHRACELVAILSAEGLVGAGQSDDLAANWRRLRSNTADQTATGRWREETNRLSRALDRTAIARSASRDRLSDDAAAGLVVGLAFPERLGRSREVGGTRYLMAGGTGAALAPSSTLRNAEWLAIAVADRSPGAVDARVRLAATIDESSAVELAASLRAGDDVISWDDGELRVRRIDRLGAIMLAERPLPDPDPAQIAAALRHAMVRDGLSMLNWSAAAQQYRDRLDFCRRNLGAPWPDVSDAALLAGLDSWLTEDLTGVRRTSDLARINVVKALKRLLPWPDAARFDELAPEWVQVPSGSRVRLDYGHAEPVLAVRIQELFGWPRVPRIADGRVEVVLHLLSPAGRTAAVTSDLASFWAQGYPQVRSELRGRYPRHPWPADPTVAQPTKRAKPRR